MKYIYSFVQTETEYQTETQTNTTMTTMMNDYIRDMLSTYFNFNTTNIKDHVIIFVITILIINATTFIYVIKILLTTRPLPITSENGKRILKPYGSTYGKNYFAYFMAYIAKLRERKKAYKKFI